jgi:hypothetical protein
MSVSTALTAFSKAYQVARRDGKYVATQPKSAVDGNAVETRTRRKDAEINARSPGTPTTNAVEKQIANRHPVPLVRQYSGTEYFYRRCFDGNT